MCGTSILTRILTFQWPHANVVTERYVTRYEPSEYVGGGLEQNAAPFIPSGSEHFNRTDVPIRVCAFGFVGYIAPQTNQHVAPPEVNVI